MSQNVEFVDISSPALPAAKPKQQVLPKLTQQQKQQQQLRQQASQPQPQKPIVTPPKVVQISQPQQKKRLQTVIATKSAVKSKSDNVVDDEGRKIERRCENPDCSAPTLISLVPTKPTPQFVQSPHVIAEPVLVNGYTTVFQIDGHPAQVCQVKGQTSDGKIRYQTNSPIYRIVPNTHAHIVNYVIVDAEGETLKKIKDNEPTTMKKLLDSQTNSANQLLKKLLGLKKVEGKIVQPSMVVSTPTIPPLVPTARSTAPIIMPQAPTITTKPVKRTVQTAVPTLLTVSKLPTAAPSTAPSQTVPITMPLQPRLVQQIQTTSTPKKVVASAPPPLLLSTASPIVVTSPSTVNPQVINSAQPQKKLRSFLRQTPSLVPTVVNNTIAAVAAPAPAVPEIAAPTATTIIADGASMNTIEKMQAELKELRETLQQLTQSAITDAGDQTSKKRKIT